MLTGRSNKQYSSSIFLSFLFITIIIISTLIYFLQSFRSLLSPSDSYSHSHSQPSSSSSPLPESLNLLAPSTTSVLFSEHPAYENLSRVHDGLWDDLLPENGGFLRRIGGEEEGAGDKGENGDEEGNKQMRKLKYGITMFHSLHCLGIMRGGVQELFREMGELRGEVEGEGMDMGKRGKEKEKRGAGHDFGHMEHGDPLHWLHCFDYLRQTILCTADGTLEPPKINLRGKENVDGMMERQCKDPEELWRLSVESFEEDD
ncbi:hypothetical protein SBOR_7657 [Sclerotinia borealis F-4128]|uniref:Uncharacterized protein n=1 Tax=Sclerotinia borealis (strain F-4128) TaxID=1432307 RepID=W9C833_SCLBF|nr:hypothetical protein SBOR_7657 [Sclerotinia borealis F-4128]